MTIPATEPLLAGPYNGNSVTTVFSYAFRIFREEELLVFVRDPAGVETLLTLGVDYSVSPTGGAFPATGGTIVMAVAPVTGDSLIILPDITRSQDRPFSSQSSITLQEIEDGLDKLTAMSRQLYERSLRAVTVSAFDPGDVDQLLANVTALVALEDEIIALTANLAVLQNVNTNMTALLSVNTNMASLLIVSAAIAAVNTVATNIASVNTVATDIANVNIVAGAVAALNTVATNIAAVNTVSVNIADVGTVATNIAAVNNVSANMTGLLGLDFGGWENENKIINGDFEVWQRAVSGSASGYTAADRWVNIATGGTGTQAQQAFALGDTLGVIQPASFLRQTVSGQTLAAHNASTRQHIEDVRSYAGQTITVLGWARRASGAGNMVIEAAQSFGTGGSPSASVTGISPTTVTLGAAWAPFAAVMTIPSVSGKTLGSGGNDHLIIAFWTSAGSDFNARANSLGLQTIGVDLWGIHIRVGTWTTAATNLYRPRNPATEMMLCERYCQQITVAAQSPVPGSVTTPWNNRVRMRAVPSLTVVSTVAAVNATVAGDTVEGTLGGYFGISASANAGYVVGRRYRLDAEL